MALFQQSVQDRYIKNLDTSAVQQSWQVFTGYFHNPVIQANIKALNEIEFQEGFMNELFVKALGCTMNPNPQYNLRCEFKNADNSKKADGAILVNNEAVAVIELKDTKTTNLDNVTNQAFGYKNHQAKATYVVTSNFEKLRFYVDHATEHIEFNLFNTSYEEFKLLYLCLAYENIAAGLPKKIKEESIAHEDKITKKLYADYAAFKTALFDNIRTKNPTYNPLVLYKSTQKLLDRLLFIFFAEDCQLLPPNFIRQIIADSQTVKKLGINESLYERFKINFQFLNTGHKVAGHDIFAYNGGLFAPDSVLDNISIDDEILSTHAIKLSNYNYQSEVDVNILGHIFENSLNELDEVKAILEGREVDKNKTKRKKDGVFYTPKYITKYIVDNTVGRLCIEKKTELGMVDADYIADKKRAAKIKKALDDKLETYRTWLLQITIVDPACGSGAFLNQALNFLIAEHRYIDELRAKLFGYGMVLTDVENSILENNLFGVDINEESVDIAKLSLWLRTAQPRRKLNNLNNNIKCGNSLIDDPAVAGDKAFNWHTEFKDVFAKGGFDVVIGNPPYVSNRTIKETDKSFYKSNYQSAVDQYDLYVLFIEKAIQLVKDKKLISFIIPDKFLTSRYGEGVLNVISKTATIETFWDLTKINVFEDASVYPIIFILQKQNAIKQKGINKESFEKKSISEITGGEITSLIKKIDSFKSIEFTVWRPLATSQNIINGDGLVVANGNIGRYNINPLKNKSSNNSRAYDIEANKIILKKLCYNIEAVLDTVGVIPINTTYCITSNTMSDLKYLLSILNSRLITFYARTKYITTSLRGGYIELRVFQIQQLPIRINSNKQPFIAKADEMLRLNKELQDISGKFTRMLMREFSLATLPGKLQNWYTLTYADFLKELNKLKVSLSLPQKAEWEPYFTKEQAAAQALTNQIQATDKAIDQMVYALYNLTPDEIKIVEGA